MRDAERQAGHRGQPGRRRGGRARRRLTTAALAAAVLAGLGTVAGCAVQAGASPSIELATAYVGVPQTPGVTVAYVVIRNNGGADRLVSAHTSAGGRVTFRAAHGAGAAVMSTIGSVRIPGHSTLAMRPDGIHMVITGAGPLHGGKDITLTLVFARAGPVSVVAQVTNPQSGGSSYFLN
jgi:copper(I)-binding protein